MTWRFHFAVVMLIPQAFQSVVLYKTVDNGIINHTSRQSSESLQQLQLLENAHTNMHACTIAFIFNMQNSFFSNFQQIHTHNMNSLACNINVKSLSLKSMQHILTTGALQRTCNKAVIINLLTTIPNKEKANRSTPFKQQNQETFFHKAYNIQ